MLKQRKTAPLLASGDVASQKTTGKFYPCWGYLDRVTRTSTEEAFSPLKRTMLPKSIVSEHFFQITPLECTQGFIKEQSSDKCVLLSLAWKIEFCSVLWRQNRKNTVWTSTSGPENLTLISFLRTNQEHCDIQWGG